MFWFRLLGAGLTAFAAVMAHEQANAAAFFVEDTIAEEGVSPADTRAATSLVKGAVASRSGDVLSYDEARADYVLQPRLMKLGESYILTVEKVRGQEVLFSAQSKIPRIDQLDRAARATTLSAIDEPSTNPRSAVTVEPSNDPRPVVIYRRELNSSTSGTTAPAPQQPVVITESSSGRIEADQPEWRSPDRKVGYWQLGFGPATSRRLESESLMYSFAAGRVWDIQPMVSLKALGELNLSSGDDGERLFNFGVGATYFMPSDTADTAPLVTADIGYGFAEDADDNSAEGMSVGLGAGAQFFRTTETTLELIVRYSMIMDNIEEGDGNPAVLGARLAVNF